MSFFSSTEILKYLVSGDIVKDIVNSDVFKEGLKDFDINEYMTDEVIEDIAEKIFSNIKIKKKLRSMIIEILSDMNIKDEVDSDYCPCGLPPCKVKPDKK